MEGLEDFRFAVEGIGLVRVMQNISSSKESRQKATKGYFGEMISRKTLAICLNSIFASLFDNCQLNQLFSNSEAAMLSSNIAFEDFCFPCFTEREE